MSATRNGWANAETWRLQLHLANNPTMARRCATIAEAFGAHAPHLPPSEMAVEQVAAVFEDWLSSGIRAAYPTVDDDGLPMFVVDTMDAVLGRIDWRAIARVWLESAGVPA